MTPPGSITRPAQSSAAFDSADPSTPTTNVRIAH
jgi:hypothetical protein